MGRGKGARDRPQTPHRNPPRPLHPSTPSLLAAYLHLVDDDLELGRALCPGVDQLHGPVEVFHVLAVHLEEGRQLLQDVSDAWVAVPGMEAGLIWSL